MSELFQFAWKLRIFFMCLREIIRNYSPIQCREEIVVYQRHQGVCVCMCVVSLAASHLVRLAWDRWSVERRMSLNSWLCLSGPLCHVLYLEKHLWVVFSHWISCPAHKDSAMSRETAHPPAAWHFPAWTSKTCVCTGGSQELQERHFDLGLNNFQESLNHQCFHIYNKTKF